MKSFLYLLIFSLLSFSACRECEDCGAKIGKPLDPYVNVQFINSDSLSAIADSVNIIDSLLKVQIYQLGLYQVAREAISKSISSPSVISLMLNDSIIINDSLVVLDGKSQISRSAFVSSAKKDTVDSATLIRNLNLIKDNFAALQVSKNAFDQIKKRLLATVLLIEKGTTKIESVNGINPDSYLEDKKDSFDIFHFPLDMNNTQSKYIIQIYKNDADTLIVDYSLKDAVADNYIKRIAHDLKVRTQDTFDSVKTSCINNCISNETTIFIYY